MTPLLNLDDVELAQLIATAALLPAGKRAAFVQRLAGLRWPLASSSLAPRGSRRK